MVVAKEVLELLGNAKDQDGGESNQEEDSADEEYDFGVSNGLIGQVQLIVFV